MQFAFFFNPCRADVFQITVHEVGRNAHVFHKFDDCFFTRHFCRYSFHAVVQICHAHFFRQRRQAHVGIVLAQQNPKFRTARKHPIRLVRAFRHQVVNQNANVRIGAFEDKRCFFVDAQMSVDARHHALASGFFVARCAVDLTRKIEVFDQFCFQSQVQLRWRKVIVFNGVTRAKHFYVLKSGYQFHRFELHIFGQRRRKPVDVNLASLPSFGFDEQLVAFFIRKTVDFIFNRRAISRTQTLNASVEHR